MHCRWEALCQRYLNMTSLGAQSGRRQHLKRCCYTVTTASWKPLQSAIEETDSTHFFLEKQRVNSRWKRPLSIFESSGHLPSCPSQRNASEWRIFSGKQRVNSCWKNLSSIFECSLIEMPFPANCFISANRSEDAYSRSRRSSSKPRERENLRATEDQSY